jgi:hypothetical protein
LYVPEDCKTLKEAVRRVEQDPRITTIVLGEGEHQIDGNYLRVSSAMKIVGRPDVPKERIVVVGGICIWFERGIQGNCHLQHLTLRQAKGNGVYGESSFTMEDVLVEQCTYSGVLADGTGVFGRCTNVEVRQCGTSGVCAYKGASITLIGAKTAVHHNCTREFRDQYGLKVYGSSASAIQLISPLTKEQVATDNSGGGNWGADHDGDIDQIATTTEDIQSSSAGLSHSCAIIILFVLLCWDALPTHVHEEGGPGGGGSGDGGGGGGRLFFCSGGAGCGGGGSCGDRNPWKGNE